MKLPVCFALGSMLVLTGCVTMPDGPSRMALPGTGKSFEQFQYDDNSCQQYGLQSAGINPNKAANDSLVNSAVLGTAVGVALGAAVGGGQGAAVGAGTGLLVGTAAGSGAASESAYVVQQRIDNAYVQCMYAKGHRVPVSGRLAGQLRATQPAPVPVAAPASRYYPPPPPPGYKGPPLPSQPLPPPPGVIN